MAQILSDQITADRPSWGGLSIGGAVPAGVEGEEQAGRSQLMADERHLRKGLASSQPLLVQL